MSLRIRLIVSIAAVLLVCLMFGGVLVYWYAVNKVDTEMRAALTVGEHTIRNAVSDARTPTLSRERLELLIADFDGDRHLRASLIADNGATTASSTPLGPREPAPGWFYRMLAGPPIILRLALPAEFAGYHAIELKSDPRNEIAEAWNDVALSLTILATFCGLVLALVYGTIGRALRPLQDLSRAFSRVGDGDYAPRVLERGPLELARLCTGFNQMVARLAEMEIRNARLAEHLAVVQEEERSDIARDLHDEIGPLLFAVNVDLASIRRHQELGAQAAIAPRVDAIREAVGQMQQHVRSMLGRLRPPTLLDLGPAQAVENLVAFWRTRYPGVAFDIDVPFESFDPATDESIYRIIQESLSNALRHGKPQHIAIAVGWTVGGFIAVEISDDGVGLHAPSGSGFGLLGMRERVQSLGGTLSVRNRVDGSGVIVSARLPCPIGDRPGSEGKAPKVAAE